MPNHKSAEKRHRQSIKRRGRNRLVKGAVRTAVKKTISAVEQNDQAQAAAQCLTAEKAIASAAAKGVLHKRTAARKISRLAKRVNKASRPAA